MKDEGKIIFHFSLDICHFSSKNRDHSELVVTTPLGGNIYGDATAEERTSQHIGTFDQRQITK